MEAILHDFYEHLRAGEILGRTCHRCGAVTFPPRSLCFRCGSRETSWVTMSGRGTLLFASAGVHLMSGAPFVLGTIRLEEGQIIPAVLLEDGFDYCHPESVWELGSANIQVRAKIVDNPLGGVMVAFQRADLDSDLTHEK